MSFAQHSLVFVIRLYQGLVSPLLAFVCGPGCGCRFTPTCSHYAIESIKGHGVVSGGWLAAKRICRCQPWGGYGFDPVPPAPAHHSELRVSAHGS